VLALAPRLTHKKQQPQQRHKKTKGIRAREHEVWTGPEATPEGRAARQQRLAAREQLDEAEEDGNDLGDDAANNGAGEQQ
jgi:hypothetical protein